MKKKLLSLSILIILFTGCNTKIDYSKFLPGSVNKFATDFILEIHKGNAENYLQMVSPEKLNDTVVQVLMMTHNGLKELPLGKYEIVNVQTQTVITGEKYTIYNIQYEYPIDDEYLYFFVEVIEQNETLYVNSLSGQRLDYSLAEIHGFNIKKKGFIHYLFLLFAFLVPIFIIITIVFILKTKQKNKWLWVIGALFGFVKFTINWTTGAYTVQTISFMVFGISFVKGGTIAPWMLSFSIPIVAIMFWVKKSNLYKKYEEKVLADSKKESEIVNNDDENEPSVPNSTYM